MFFRMVNLLIPLFFVDREKSEYKRCILWQRQCLSVSLGADASASAYVSTSVNPDLKIMRDLVNFDGSAVMVSVSVHTIVVGDR